MPVPVVLLSIPQLRHRDVTPGALASLEGLAARGSMTPFYPAFPSLAAPSFATMVTGVGPSRHGMIGDAYFDRQERRVVARPFPDQAVLAPKLWDRLREARPDTRSLAWFAPNLRGAAVDLAAWVDNSQGVRTNPPGLAESLVGRFGPYPWPRVDPSGEPSRLEATTWILRTAAATIAAESPDLAIVRVPYIGQVARRYGPDGRVANRAILDLEPALASFLAALPPEVVILAATESVSTPVTEPLHPNRVLRDLGLLTLTPVPSGGQDIDLERSAAFALADHQIAHIYLNDPSQAAVVASTFSDAASEGVDVVACGDRRARLGIDHPRAGDVVLVSSPDHWFAPDWWTTDAERPDCPGLALCPHGPRDPSRVLGSLGAPPPNTDYLGVLVASRPDLLSEEQPLAALDLVGLIAPFLEIEPPRR